MKGKLIWRSLKTEKISIAKLKCGDVEKEERKKAEEGFVRTKDKVLIRHCIEAYRLKGFRPAKPRNKKDVKALKPAAQFSDAPVIVAALDRLLKDPDSPWQPALVGSNATIGLAGELVGSALLGREVVRNYMLAGLREKAHAGVITYTNSPFSTNEVLIEYQYDVGWNCSQNLKRTDKLPEDMRKEYPIWVCDLFAEQLTSLDSAPAFALFWPLEERDQAITRIAEFVQQPGDKLTDLVEQKRKREWWRH